jgi:hypothetical protein
MQFPISGHQQREATLILQSLIDHISLEVREDASGFLHDDLSGSEINYPHEAANINQSIQPA